MPVISHFNKLFSNNNNNNNDNNNQNMNQNMNNVQSNNGRGLLEAGGVTAWLEEKVAESPGCVERFVCETFRTGQSLQGPAYYLMALSKYDSQPGAPTDVR